jgi:hypothetical protein
MTLGVGAIRTCATSPRRTCPPSGVSIGMSAIAVGLDRVRGVLQTITSRTWAGFQTSFTSGPATRIDAARRTSPGFRP